MKLHSVLLAAVVVLWTASASAVTFQILSTSTSNGSPLNALDVGETVTVNLRIIDSVDVFGLGASAFSYDEAVVDFQSGQSVTSINHAQCFVGIGCFTGLDNQPGAQTHLESAIGANGNRVQIFNGVGLTATNTNASSPGLDGIIDGGDAQVRIVFVAVANGSSTIRFGTGYEGDGEILAGGTNVTSANTNLAITVPEPASLAAGLAALASVAGVVAMRRRF